MIIDKNRGTAPVLILKIQLKKTHQKIVLSPPLTILAFLQYIFDWDFSAYPE